MIKQCHISRYSVFFKDNILFAYFEYTGNDFERDMEMMAADKETQRWWDVVKPLMDPLETRQPGEFWANMKEVFHLD
jgi:L-rhamnose mutarotase